LWAFQGREVKVRREGLGTDLEVQIERPQAASQGGLFWNLIINLPRSGSPRSPPGNVSALQFLLCSLNFFLSYKILESIYA
jgi:hypothetical protein